ncbi:unnamed protein product [Protopolystoma xenopodis]|uniref:Uncharacterized protein n=1 Tax=Protopolystoma xenopodis TaxID=117903 RepID=A0A3S5APJ5_9PLAT|nr:unnamed protein product [Protopolystoma xenopodis]
MNGWMQQEQYLHPAYASHVTPYQLTLKGEVEEEHTESKSELEALLLPHQNSEKAVCYDLSVLLTSGWGSSVLGAADGPTSVLEPGAHFAGRGFPERRTR